MGLRYNSALPKLKVFIKLPLKSAYRLENNKTLRWIQCYDKVFWQVIEINCEMAMHF